MKKFLATAAFGIVALALCAPSITHGADNRIATGYYAYKKPFELKQCLQRAKKVADDIPNATVEVGYYNVWAEDKDFIVSITCQTEANSVFFVVSGPKARSDDTFKSILSGVQNHFDPDQNKLKLNRNARPNY
jgi:hypothetical protein